MENLKNLLDFSGIEKENVNNRFQKIAETLMGNFVIQKGNKRYSIVEIEFYLYTPIHQDFITYPRIMKSGRWFFHQSGVDLTFKTEGELLRIKERDKNNKEIIKLNYENCSFGGILIRGIYDIKGGEYIFGPQKCVSVLWDDFDAFGKTEKEYPILEKLESGIPNNLIECKRHINIQGEDNQRSKIKEWIKRLGKTISEQELEDYRKNMFVTPDTMRYRFFNLQKGEKPWNLTKIPANVRPKEEETIRVK